MRDIATKIAEELGIKTFQVERTVKLIDEGNTIPFIARYRKEVTGNLDDETLRKLNDRLTYLRNLELRKEEVIRLIEEQGKLTEALKNDIQNANILTEVEDLYRPYKQKKRTRATIAKERGLEPLALQMLEQKEKSGNLYEIAREYVNADKGVKDVEEAILGAQDIIAEMISDNASYRKNIRRISYMTGKIVSTAVDEEKKSTYDMYYHFSENVKWIPSHRVLAMNRGEKEGFLKVKLEVDDLRMENYLIRRIITGESIYKEKVIEAIKDSYKRLIKPSIEREIRADKFEVASDKAIEVFGVNLKSLILSAPLKDKVVMGFDPAYRTGCKVAVIDETGKLLGYNTVYPTLPQEDIEGATQILTEMIEKYKVDMIAIGNGTASRESEKFIADLIKKVKREVYYTIVSEAGASVYSASELASEEYPDVNVSIRGAISIARRLQDPMAELVKITPKSIGVGQYQHDVNQKRLESKLEGIVEDAVNSVGVDLNTATPSLLSYVSGVNHTVSHNIVKYREEHGKFTSREELLEVPKLGKRAFVQCAGFLKVPESENILDNTMVHPESYQVAKELLKDIGYDLSNLDIKRMREISPKLNAINVEKEAQKLNVGVPTVEDIIKELKKPGRDPRDELPKPILKSDVLKLEDLKEGMILKGTVRNVTGFGAFIDIGIKNSALVHISEMSDKFIKDPMEVVSTGDIVNVRVIGIDKEKGKVSLTLKGLN
ncbi:MAG: Tex family protein [Clostridia bacterium]|nr:Tex family protein [Clostridia bacterium]